MTKKRSHPFRPRFHKSKKVNSGHPTYVFAKKKTKYSYLGLTHSNRTNGVENEPLKKNPNPNDTSKAYFRPVIEEASKSDIGRAQQGWSFCEEDKKKVSKFIRHQKNKRH